MQKNNTIGLFGTCGKSTWRKRFIDNYESRSINYFNPQVDNWKPEDAEIEAKHLATDSIILFPVLGETYGWGSLAETGFSISQAMKMDDRRYFVLLIDKQPEESLQSNPELFKESCRSRALVRAHLNKVSLPNVFFVDTLDQMLTVSLKLNKAVEILNSID